MSTRVFVGGLSYRVRERDLERFFRKYGNVKDISMKNGYAFVEFDDYRDADDAVYELNGKDLMGERVIVEHARGTDRSRRSRDRFGGGGGGGFGRRGGRFERVSVERARGTPRGSDRWKDAAGDERRRDTGDDRRRDIGSGGDRDRDRGWTRIVVPPLRRRGRSPRRDRSPVDRRDRGGRPNDRYGPPTRTDYRLTVENLSSRVSWQDLKDYMRQAGEVTYADAHKNRRNEGVVEFISSADMKAAIEKLDGAELNGRKIRLVEDKSRRGRGRGSRSSSGSRSRSRSRSRRSRSRRSSRSRSRSKSAGSRSKSRSRSKAKADRKSRSKSRSKSPKKAVSRSRSRSKSPPRNGGASKDRSASRSRSRSPIKRPKSGSESPSKKD